MATLADVPGSSGSIDSLLKLAESDIIPGISAHDIDYYLYERYQGKSGGLLRKAYYAAKPFLPRSVQLMLRRRYVTVQAGAAFPAWPREPVLVDLVRDVLRTALSGGAAEIRRIAPWPAASTSAFVITHDVEWDAGLRHAPVIAELEGELGFTSSWNIVPERYPIDWKIVDGLRAAGCEIGIHGLKHDGKLFQSRRIFEARCARINEYARQWNAVGFRSPSTLRNADWMPQLQFEYDSSFPDTDPYEPQPGGCCFIWPYFLGNMVELPMTLPQDHTLFEILGKRDIVIWKEKAEWIMQHGGLVLINIHPDYMLTEERLGFYREFLLFMKNALGVWHALPRDVAKWWRDRDASRIRGDGNGYSIEGPAAGRAAILQTFLSDGELEHIPLPEMKIPS
jgi:hypothetical protein